MVRRSIVAGIGSYLPERIVTNAELAARIDTSDEWIQERSGIQQRHIVADGEMTSDLATCAAQRALAAAGMEPDDIGIIVVATSTPDETFPATATVVQSKLGCANGSMGFDVQAVCSGFVFALATADNFIKVGQVDTALVIGAETFSKILDWEDRSTCVLFGDGAGAVVLKAGEGDGSSADRGVLSTHLHSDGRLHDLLYVDGGPSSTGQVGHLRMEGREVFKHAVTKMSEVTIEALEATGLHADDIDWFVPHQANRRIIDGTARKLGITGERVVVTIGQHANTSAASIPLALSVAVEDKRIQEGNLVLLEAMGGGLTWGSGIVRW
ncbi:MAG: ketoacyl-ACP synthase III [Rhodospirillaceae bacterium]|jgi:3-oxoacyl-[acyl-carrier-protein] synthase-3|nr:ketoacyl-ACP synthase III [Rhodospirillaceae bacterium]MBT3808143.1 ketoacyl-ACP synthase III [Rhodospirillaceae bacterium]MBT3931210.1 ketoacyl-ACP synthase III [Rhodospirillaceae bacterium]MBT4772080.1 ketoacyl-ACP synthase III [Rhodospirillaceae bacterium]MBT5357179.1 ketoacyl-ACP synthase III [Rhodospirillaceae bacterium]